MCNQTGCIKWWMAVIVGFLSDTANPCPTSAEGATFLRGVRGFSPGKFWKVKAEWWHLEVFVALFSCQNQITFFSEAMCTQLRICVQGATPLVIKVLIPQNCKMIEVCTQGYQTLKHSFVMDITRKYSSSILQNALQLDYKMIVSTNDDVLSCRNHKHLITTRKQIHNCSFVYVTLCKMVMTGSWYAQQTNISLCHAGLWVAMGTGMQLCYIPAHLVYAHLGPDQSRALTFFIPSLALLPPFVLVKE